eukprot:TRINITY_DN5829_c0_g5_i1.p1 TRINITY_DN5829_c0_g5~~TRINITY_DN5829_c0_g5_i1.p1  ORF type:complete len:646 (+),score=219.93 TRINITY_DN5829_c0_g5_i1:118-2055(+)
MLSVATRLRDDDDESDEEVRWADAANNAWEELLKCYQHEDERREQQPLRSPEPVPKYPAVAEVAERSLSSLSMLSGCTEVSVDPFDVFRGGATPPRGGGKDGTTTSIPTAVSAPTPAAARKGMQPGRTQEEDREFLEFFPEWRTDGAAEAIALTPSKAAAPPPPAPPAGARKRKRGGGIFPADDDRARQAACIESFSPTPQRRRPGGSQISAFTPPPPPTKKKKREAIETPASTPRPNDPISYYGEGHLRDPIEAVDGAEARARGGRGVVDAIGDFDDPDDAHAPTAAAAARKDRIQQRLQANRQAEARLEALAQFGLEQNPNAHCLVFQTAKHRQQLMGPPPAAPLHPAGPQPGMDDIIDAGPAPARPAPDNSWLRRIIAGERVVPGGRDPRAPTPKQSPWQAAAHWFKVQHAPQKYKAGQLSSFLANTQRVLAHQQRVLARNDPAVAAPTAAQGEHVLHLQVASLAGLAGGGKCVRCRVVSGRALKKSQAAATSLTDLTRSAAAEDLTGHALQVMLSSHQIQAMALAVNDEFRVHPPYHLRHLGAGRRIVMGADFITAVNVASAAQQAAPALSVALANTAATGGSEQIGRPPTAARAAEWPEVSHDEWELPEGTWEKIASLLAVESQASSSRNGTPRNGTPRA